MPLPPEVAAALTTVAAAPRLLVASDFDGVLAPFVLDPMDARPQSGTIESLRELAEAEDTWAAVISGRDLDTLEQLSGLADSSVTRIGSHGAETSRDRAPVADAETAARLARLRSDIEAVVADRDPRIRVEHKPTAIVLHTRDLPAESLATAADIAEAATGPGVRLLAGKGVHELSVLSADKGSALRSLARELDIDAVVYLGDDVTDEHAFEVLRADDLGIKIGSGESAARVRVPGEERP